MAAGGGVGWSRTITSAFFVGVRGTFRLETLLCSLPLRRRLTSASVVTMTASKTPGSFRFVFIPSDRRAASLSVPSQQTAADTAAAAAAARAQLGAN